MGLREEFEFTLLATTIVTITIVAIVLPFSVMTQIEKVCLEKH